MSFFLVTGFLTVEKLIDDFTASWDVSFISPGPYLVGVPYYLDIRPTLTISSPPFFGLKVLHESIQ